MKLLIITKFWPSMGGIESLTESLARCWSADGHNCTIVTDVAATTDQKATFPYEVIRNPSKWKCFRLVSVADIVVLNNVSLKAIWIPLLLKRPTVVVHHSFYHPYGQRQSMLEKAKVKIARSLTFNICVSQAVADRLNFAGPVIPNPYDDELFLIQRSVIRNKDLVFLGRLVSEKGVSILLAALKVLRRQDIRPNLTIIGDGPERISLQNEVAESGLQRQVEFIGEQQRQDLSRILNQHRVMVIPSLCDETFGIVALEGIACGCRVVGSSGGGLAEAIGPAGSIFESGNAIDLANKIKEVLPNEEEGLVDDNFHMTVANHLERHKANLVASAYIVAFERFLARK